MAVIRMKPFCVVGMLDYKAKVLRSLQKLGCAEIKNSDFGFKTIKSVDVSNLEKNILNTGRAIEVLKKFCKKKFVNFKRIERYSKLVEISKKSNCLLQQVSRVNFCCEKIEQNCVKILNLEQEKNALAPYVNFDYCLANFETAFVKCFVGTIVGRLSKQNLVDIFKDEAYFEIVDENKFKTVVFFVVLKENYAHVRKILSDLKFSAFNFNLEESTPSQRIDFCSAEIEKLNGENLKFELELKNMKNLLDEFELFFDYLNLELDFKKKFNVLDGTHHTFFIEGYLNPEKESEFKKLASRFGLCFEIEQPDENSPSDFKNVGMVTPIEQVTKTYSMPSVFDVDPNPTMAFFYYLFFGMMFSDAGYGLLMSIFCSVFAFSSKVDRASKNKFKMFFWCGVSTTFWGLMFGSFFGDFVAVASKTFFGLNFSLAPLLIDTLNKPMELLGFSLMLGLFQILVGVFVRFFALIKTQQFKEAFFVQFGWLLFLFGAGLLSVVVLFLGHGQSAAILKPISLGLTCVGAAAIVLLSGYKNKGFMKLVGGLISFYGVTSYVGDVLSYCRLMALAIATGVVANVVNLLSSMLCVNFFGCLLFAVVFVFGHAMNFGINALGAYVHTTRLQYVEFFSKFYEGGGRLFVPFSFKHTKYVEIDESEK